MKGLVVGAVWVCVSDGHTSVQQPLEHLCHCQAQRDKVKVRRHGSTLCPCTQAAVHPHDNKTWALPHMPSMLKYVYCSAAEDVP